jgi:transposase
MEQLIDCCAGLDVHRDTVVATVRAQGLERRERRIATRTFATTTGGLSELGDWLAAEQVELVGMESTGVYWKPVFFALEERIDQVWLLNAEHLRNVPGRKPMSLFRCGSPSWSSTGWCGRVSCRRPISVRCAI